MLGRLNNSSSPAGYVPGVRYNRPRHTPQRSQTNPESDTLHLISLLLKYVQIQVKHKNELGKTCTPDIGSPQGAVPVLSTCSLSSSYIKHRKL